MLENNWSIDFNEREDLAIQGEIMEHLTYINADDEEEVIGKQFDHKDPSEMTLQELIDSSGELSGVKVEAYEEKSDRLAPWVEDMIAQFRIAWKHSDQGGRKWIENRVRQIKCEEEIGSCSMNKYFTNLGEILQENSWNVPTGDAHEFNQDPYLEQLTQAITSSKGFDRGTMKWSKELRECRYANILSWIHDPRRTRESLRKCREKLSKRYRANFGECIRKEISWVNVFLTKAQFMYLIKILNSMCK